MVHGHADHPRKSVAFERGPDWQSYAVRDRNLITGQNPQSSELVARQMRDALKQAKAA